MSSAAFANAGQPHGALFDDAPRVYHVTDAAMLRAAYGPAADDEYTWTEQALPAGLPEATPTAHDRRLAELDAGLRALQAEVRHLQTLVHQLLNVGEEPDAE